MLERDSMGTRFGDSPPDIAYHLEGQAIAVREAQIAGRLMICYITFSNFRIVDEFGLSWYRLGNLNLFSGDCDEEAMSELQPNQQLVEIIDPRLRPDVFDGRNECPIAAVLSQRTFIYKSPGFDYEAFLQAPNQNRKLLKEFKQRATESSQVGHLTHKQMRVIQRAKRRETRRIAREQKRMTKR